MGDEATNSAKNRQVRREVERHFAEHCIIPVNTVNVSEVDIIRPGTRYRRTEWGNRVADPRNDIFGDAIVDLPLHEQARR